MTESSPTQSAQRETKGQLRVALLLALAVCCVGVPPFSRLFDSRERRRVPRRQRPRDMLIDAQDTTRLIPIHQLHSRSHMAVHYGSSPCSILGVYQYGPEARNARAQESHARVLTRRGMACINKTALQKHNRSHIIYQLHRDCGNSSCFINVFLRSRLIDAAHASSSLAAHRELAP